MKAVNIDREEVLQDMRRVYNEHGKLTSRLYREYGNIRLSTIEKKLCRFNDLKKEALGEESLHLQTVTKELLIEDALRVYQEHDKITQESYVEYGKYSRKPILRLFGSWNNMLKELELPINCLINISEEELIAELQRIYEECDAISATVVKNHGKYCVEVYQRRFGSFNKAIEIAGLDSRVRGRTSPQANAMISMLESVLGEKAEPEETADWLVNPETGKKLYVDAFFPAHNLAFEYNGPQHYMPIKHFGGEEAYAQRQKLDHLKESLLRENGFNILIMKYDEPKTREHLIVRLAEIFKQ